MTRTFDLRVADLLRPHQQQADELIDLVRQTAAELFEVPYHAPKIVGAFEVTRQPYWVTHRWDTQMSPIPENLVTKILPPGKRRARILAKWTQQIEELVRNNVENLRWATLQSLNDAFRRFTATLDERLQATIAATHGAIQAAKTKWQAQTINVTPEVTRLQSATKVLLEVQAELEAFQANKSN